MIKECNFKQVEKEIKICVLCNINTSAKDNNVYYYECQGEDNCILFQIYKKGLPPIQKCGICGEDYNEDVDWSHYLGDINFSIVSPPFHRKCYEKYCKEHGFDG